MRSETIALLNATQEKLECCECIMECLGTECIDSENKKYCIESNRKSLEEILNEPSGLGDDLDLAYAYLLDSLVSKLYGYIKENKKLESEVA